MSRDPNWWSPTEAPAPTREAELLSSTVALEGARRGVELAQEHQVEWSRDRKVWAMRTLQALEDVADEIEEIRKQCCAVAVNEGVTLREISAVTGTTHATVRKWAEHARATGAVPASQHPWMADVHIPWRLSRDEVQRLAQKIGVDPDVTLAWSSETTTKSSDG